MKKIILAAIIGVAVFGACKYASNTTYEAKAEIGWRYNEGNETVYRAVCKGNGFRVDGEIFEFYGDGFELTDSVILTVDSKGTQTYEDDEIKGVRK